MAVCCSSLFAAPHFAHKGPIRCGVMPREPACANDKSFIIHNTYLRYSTDGVGVLSQPTRVRLIGRTESRLFSVAPSQSALQCSHTPTLRACAPLPRLTQPVNLSSITSPSLQATPSAFRIAWVHDSSYATAISPPLLTAKPLTTSAEIKSTAAATLRDAKAQIYEIIQDTRGALRRLGEPTSTEAPGTSGPWPLETGGSFTIYAPEDVRQRMDSLVSYVIARNPSDSPGPASLSLGPGVWEVFHAPHISRFANLLHIKFDPIRYSLRGTKIWSNVHYQVPLLGEGWLSASGSFSANGENAVNVLFDSFWWDASPQSLRSEDPHIEGPANNIVNAVGKLAFLPQFSVFPVLYVDGDMTVFRFTPLSSNIAARRVY